MLLELKSEDIKRELFGCQGDRMGSCPSPPIQFHLVRQQNSKTSDGKSEAIFIHISRGRSRPRQKRKWLAPKFDTEQFLLFLPRSLGISELQPSCSSSIASNRESPLSRILGSPPSFPQVLAQSSSRLRFLNPKTDQRHLGKQGPADTQGRQGPGTSC